MRRDPRRQAAEPPPKRPYTLVEHHMEEEEHEAQQIELARRVGEQLGRERAAEGPGPDNELLALAAVPTGAAAGQSEGPASPPLSSCDQSDQRTEQQQGPSGSAVHSQAGGTQGTQGAAAGLQLLLEGLPGAAEVADEVADEAMFYENMEEVFADYEKQRSPEQQRDLEKVRVRRPPGGACREIGRAHV